MTNDPSINNSGNSNVNVTVNIDTTPLAYFMGSYLHATKQLDDEQYLLMMNNLNTLIGKNNEQLKNLIPNSKPLNSKTTKRRILRDYRRFIAKNN